MVAHDLRNPLGTIEMASSFLIEQSTDAQGLVEGHGGRIWVESGPGEGSVFRFTLRRAMPVAAAAMAE